jgi:hypothetical protein
VPFLSKFPRVNTILILIIFMAWIYTEIDEQKARTEWRAFIEEGSRFTGKDGDLIAARICRLERSSGIKCEPDQ